MSEVYKTITNQVRYTADNEEPICGRCHNQQSFNCNKCGPQGAWHGYYRIVEHTTQYTREEWDELIALRERLKNKIWRK